MRTKWCCALFLVLSSAMAWGQQDVRILMPIALDAWYPANPAELYQSVTSSIASANTQDRDYLLTGMVVPNARYNLSGGIAGQAFKLIKPGQYDRVIILTPSHHAVFRGCSIPSVQLARTPLGDVPLDMEAIHSLTKSSLISLRSVFYEGQKGFSRSGRAPLHEREHGIEVLLPFLQVQLGQDFSIVPIVVGELKTLNDNFDRGALKAIVHALTTIVDDRTLVIVSTNFTHYGPEFGYRPFNTDILNNLSTMDMAAIDCVLDRDADALLEFVKQTDSNIPGIVPLLIMMELLSTHSSGILLGYDTSGRMKNDPSSSVSYASLAFYDTSKPAALQKEVRTLFTPRPSSGTAAQILPNPANIAPKQAEQPASQEQTSAPSDEKTTGDEKSAQKEEQVEASSETSDSTEKSAETETRSTPRVKRPGRSSGHR